MHVQTSILLLCRRSGLLAVAILGSLAWTTTGAIAAFDVAISSAATSHMTFAAGVYEPTAASAVLNIADLENNLGSGDITVRAAIAIGTQPGDIYVETSGTWSANKLTLEAQRSINIGAPGAITVAVTGTAGLSLTINDGGSGGQLSFANGANVTLASVTQTLLIKGARYTLVNSVSTTGPNSLQASIISNPSCPCALINTYDATSDGTYHSSPIGTPFTGTFEGLGNSVSHLTVTDSTKGDPAAFFVHIASSGAIRDFSLNNASISGVAYDNGNSTHLSRVGGLVAWNEGTLANDSIQGNTASISIACSGCTSADFTYVGGLSAENQGIVTGSNSSSPVSSTVAGTYLGGLVGENDYASTSELALTESSSSSATVTVVGSSDRVGGLVGDNAGGIVENSNATGVIDCVGTGGNAGGLVGWNAKNSGVSPNGYIVQSYATGPVGSTTTCGYSGGLVGENGVGGIIGPIGATPVTSYASGSVFGSTSSSVGGLVGDNAGIVEFAYAKGPVKAHGAVGGLAGQNGGTISQSFTISSVDDVNGSPDVCCSYGGLVGSNFVNGIIKDSYSIGNVTTYSSYVGGSVGAHNSSSRTAVISSVYETGAVSSTYTSACIGGFVGRNNVTTETNTANAIYDSTTSGQGSGWGTLPGCSANGAGISPLDSNTLKSALPSGFDPTIWTRDPNGIVNNGFPYLISNPPP